MLDAELVLRTLTKNYSIMKSVYLYFCRKFEKEISHKGYEKIVRNKLKEIAQLQELKSGSNSLSEFRDVFVLKTGSVAKTLLQKVVLEEPHRGVIYFVREVIDREDWVKTFSSQVKSGHWTKNYPLSEEEKEAGIQAYLEYLNKEENNKRISPPDAMVAWFKDNEFTLKLGLEIYEAEGWVRYAANNTEGEGLRDKDLNSFQDLLYSIVSEDGTHKELLTEARGGKIWAAKNQRVGVIFTFVEELGKKYYLIYNGANLSDQSEHWKQIQDNFKKSNNRDIPTRSEDIQRLALRAYPSYTLKPQQSYLWEKIQKSSENSNYSLLKEQMDFLQNFKFPSYINGQAGSGKSTMLYYIFANVYFLKKLGAIKGDIIFLTENEKLLENTKTAIKDLLLNNPEFGLNFQTDFDDFDTYFASFKHFLLDLMPEDDRLKFPVDKYLDFSHFKKLYEESSIRQSITRRYSAEESWFAITTYVKGYADDCVISSSSYEQEVSQKSRILSKETIQGVEENILPFYNKLVEEKGYWDRLKIIQYIQNKLSLNKKFEVVICDEAQDFCRVELRFILRLCELLQYDLSNTEQVPVLFAGDPNQTVNPTGFRLDEMKDILYEELKKMAGFDIKLQGEIINSPKYNYRSSQAVVTLANYIQYYRKKIFDIHVKEPQIAKQSEIWHNQAHQNVFLEKNAVIKNQNLVNRLQYKAFIIPSEQQEKTQYTNEQPLFTEAIKEADIKTAIESKGAEYKQVVLYGFGEEYFRKFGKLTLRKASNDDDFEQRYFFNKLYVGITRAKDELIIIDSERAKNDFWQKIEAIEIVEEDWKTIAQKGLILYDTDSILDSTPETALDNAQHDKAQGINNANPNQLRVAAKQFFRLNENNEQNECLALAEKMQGNWKEAAQYFAKTKNGMEQSAECYWQGRLLREMLINLTNLKTPEHSVRVVFAKMMEDEENTLNFNELNELYHNKHLIRRLTQDITWRGELIKKLIQVAQSLENKDSIRRFAEVLLEIATSEDTKLYEASGNLFHAIKEFDWAITAWDNIDNFEEKQVYVETKIELAIRRRNINDEIIWRDKLLTHQEASKKLQTCEVILRLYDENQDKIQDEYSLLALYKAMFFVEVQEKKLLSIAKKIEEKFIHKPHVLQDFYDTLLRNFEQIDSSLWSYILERWAKHSFAASSPIEKINHDYQQWADTYTKVYQPFSEAEIQGLEDIPKSVFKKPSQHFQNICIQNFRIFEEITLQNLGQFNLIVGDNNTGKTSLLEALTFSPGEEEFTQRLALCYAERCNNFDFITLKNDFWEDFIFQHNSKAELNFTILSGRNEWNYLFPKNKIEAASWQKLSQEDSIKTPFISYGKGFDRFLAQIYSDHIHKQGKSVRQDFLGNLQVFIPTIEEIVADSEEILVEEKGNDKGRPLFQYGEGANKLFRILLQMTLNKGGRIMIDEIDAGIHFSRFKRFWKILIRLAQKNDIQLFATTHNLECIQYFADALNELDEEGSEKKLLESARTITLYQTQEGKIKARTRSFEAFSEAVEEGYNIRGGE